MEFLGKRKIENLNRPSDIDNFDIDDFEDPFEAFYWLGFFASRERPKAGDGEKKPFCETAEFAVFDTETSGLSSSDCAVQVAIGFFDANGKAIGFYERLWRLPEGKKISHGSYLIHKITMKMLAEDGMHTPHELRKVARFFSRMKARGKAVVAHNANFDVRILKQTAQQHGVEDWNLSYRDVFCTMTNAKHRCGLKSQKTGKPKAPSNAELYKVLFLKSPTGALHDALEDVKVTAKSYSKGRELGWW